MRLTCYRPLAGLLSYSYSWTHPLLQWLHLLTSLHSNACMHPWYHHIK
jgi:hypothetical protein